MATTTNYGWTTPDDTALVKDGASAIRTLGTSVDTTTKNLNPSTTLGDTEFRSSTSNVNTRLGIGSTGQVLTVAAGVPSWATPAGGGSMTLISTTNLTGASVTLSAIPGTYRDLRLVIKDFYHNVGAGTAVDLKFTVNGTSSIYAGVLSNTSGITNPLSNARGDVAESVLGVANDNFAIMNFFEYTSTTTNKYAQSQSVVQDAATPTYRLSDIRNGIRTLSAITSITLLFNSGSFVTAGTVELYGVN
jgi:hypothetical protein